MLEEARLEATHYLDIYFTLVAHRRSDLGYRPPRQFEYGLETIPPWLTVCFYWTAHFPPLRKRDKRRKYNEQLRKKNP
ncbi:hypothetical protein [Hymenobacter sp.]|uniref:hypothetical protein n=1 Tax=Hymenobacter sp. TaxID=1898978 RepID=UPI00286C61D4|nr:hypothetical protein [Hymenobacter sp.]